MLVEMCQIHKTFQNVRALQGVDFHLEAGEVHVLLGENGAGKSTLMKILAGAEQPDAGQILLLGRPVSFASPQEARAHGIRAIYQELSLVPDLTVAENICLDRLPRTRLGFLDRREAVARARVALGRLGCDLDPLRLAGTLSLAEQQLVEIARAVSASARVLIMDEPTAALSAAETERLFEVVRQLQGEGVGIVYITHRLEEIPLVATRVSVLRGGRNAGSFPADVGLDRLIAAMIGHTLRDHYPVVPREPGGPLLEVDDLAVGIVSGISFRLHEREILGVAGLVGSGLLDLARCLFGVLPPSRGSIRMQGRPLRLSSPAAAIAAGIGYVPEDRKEQGLIMVHSVASNVSLAALGGLSTAGFIRRRAEEAMVRELIARLRIVTPGAAQPVGLLSGGNQQKVVLARWLGRRGRVLIVSEPTRGVDVGSRTEIYRLLGELAQQGYGILVLSSDLQEVAGLCDRCLVLRRGRLVGEVDRAAAQRGELLALATGAQRGVVA